MADTVYLLERGKQLGDVDLLNESRRIADGYVWFAEQERLQFETCVDGCLFQAQPVSVKPMSGCGAWVGLGLVGGILIGKKAGALVTGGALVAGLFALRQGRADFALDWVFPPGR